MFKQHLIDHVTNSLNDLADFIKTADKGLLTPVEEGDYQGLVDVMGHLMAVKDRQATTDEMFEPLKQTIELLKTYDQEMPEVVGFFNEIFLHMILLLLPVPKEQRENGCDFFVPLPFVWHASQLAGLWSFQRTQK